MNTNNPSAMSVTSKAAPLQCEHPSHTNVHPVTVTCCCRTSCSDRKYIPLCVLRSLQKRLCLFYASACKQSDKRRDMVSYNNFGMQSSSFVSELSSCLCITYVPLLAGRVHKVFGKTSLPALLLE